MNLPTISNITIEIVEDVTFPFYIITPNEGYVLHDKALDFAEVDMSGFPTGKTILGYYPSNRTCMTNYDFDNTTIIDGHTAFGSREFFAIKEDVK